MSTPNGYNNPAYCHQYDSSLYDYQYVPEIDPDSPDLREESNRRSNHIKLVHPSFANFRREPSESEEFEGSDESNPSIIIEECNNRRVTLICEKRNKAETGKDEYYEEDGDFRGAYYQDISLESENGYESQGSKNVYEGRSLRHQRPLQPPVEEPCNVRSYPMSSNNYEKKVSSNAKLRQSTTSLHSYQRGQRQHRYEEIPCDDDYDAQPPSAVHRYAEISPDENGYPTLKKEIQIEQSRSNRQDNYPRVISKPRAISPVNYPKSFSPPPTPGRIHHRTPQSKEFDFNLPQFSPNSPSPIIYSSSPLKTNSIEMSELSPPRSSSNYEQSGNDHTFFIRSPKRQPPIGASAAGDTKESYRCILPKNLQEISSKSRRDRSHSLPNSPKRRRDHAQIASSPSKPQSDKKITQIFHIKSSQSKPKSNPRGKLLAEKENTPARRNISNSFRDDYVKSPMMTRSPYKPTTMEIPPKTAIITPIFQRKNQEGTEGSFSPKRNFEKMSQAFQSTGNIFRNTRETVYPSDVDFPSSTTQDRLTGTARIKRNQSVPNFSQTLAAESRGIVKKNKEAYQQENQKYSANLDLQYSPKKPIEHVVSMEKSRISLMDNTSSWSNLESDFHPQCSTCFIFAAIVHLLTGIVTCVISFYLLSKVGRRYYLDFGLLAGFVNFILGLLGFRSYCWRWLPNRNYVSGFIGLAAFSAINCAGLAYLITARPMAGDPILDIMGGAICAVSVLTIVLALTGLTMSGCCKAPPPDNRVTDI